jgi:hypothetical protein
MKTSYKCPICSQSIVNMESQFRNLDRAIDGQPMPPQFQDTKAMVSCNDCYAKSLVKYHWLGLKCAICDSYNTAQLQILTLRDDDTEVPPVVIPETENTPEITNGINNASDSRRRLTLPNGVHRNRRHSSHTLPVPIATQTSRFSPYQVPQRIGRSVSPFRSDNIFNSPVHLTEPIHTGESEDEEDLDFWGGHAPRTPLSHREHEAKENEEELSDSDSVSTDDDFDDDDDGDEEDRMELFGHR